MIRAALIVIAAVALATSAVEASSNLKHMRRVGRTSSAAGAVWFESISAGLAKSHPQFNANDMKHISKGWECRSCAACTQQAPNIAGRLLHAIVGSKLSSADAKMPQVVCAGFRPIAEQLCNPLCQPLGKPGLCPHLCNQLFAAHAEGACQALVKEIQAECTKKGDLKTKLVTGKASPNDFPSILRPDAMCNGHFGMCSVPPRKDC